MNTKQKYVLLTWLDDYMDPPLVSFKFDVVTTDSYEATMAVTAHPVEKGAPIVDHARPDPVRIDLEGFVSNTPLPSNLTAFERSQRVMDFLPTPLDYSEAEYADRLQELKLRKQTLPVYTPGGLTQVVMGALGQADPPLPKQATAFRATGEMPDRAADALRKLKNVRDRRLLVTVANRYHQIENMLIDHLAYSRTVENAGGLALDVATFDAIDLGERADVSAGYAARLDFTPGVFEGEAYDCVQREIRFNHVALCPQGRGRSGPEVGVRLDQLRAEPAFSALAQRVDALFGSRSRGDVLRYDAPIPLKYVVPPKDGVTCACKVRRNDQGRLERTDECSCSRDGGVVDHEHGPRRVSGVAERTAANPFEAAALAAAKLRMVRSDAFTEITRAAANLRRR